MPNNNQLQTEQLQPNKNDSINPQGVDNQETESKKSLFITALEVLQTDVPATKFLVESLIPKGAISLICGPSDTGKSILARQIAAAVSLGKDSIAGFKLNLEHNAALYLSTEDAQSDWNDKLSKYKLTEEEKQKLKNLYLGFEQESFTIKNVEAALLNNPVDIVFVDVFTDIFVKDLNNSIQVREFLNPYRDLAIKHNCSIVFIHHVSKKGESSTPSKANVLGSMAIEAKVRSVLELRMNQDNNYRDLFITKSNYLSPTEKELPYKLHLKSETLEFEDTGERPAILKKSGTRVALTETVIKKILSLNKEGLSYREMEIALKAEGIPVGKTKIGEIINQFKQDKDNELPVTN